MAAIDKSTTNKEPAQHQRRNIAFKLMLICIASILPVMLTAWFGPQEGLETLIILLPLMLMVGTHVVLGPAALYFAWINRDQVFNILIWIYFFGFSIVMLGYMAWVNEVPEALRGEWRDITSPEDAALSSAIRQRDGSLKAIESALSNGADVNVLTPDYRTPLIEAVSRNNLAAVKRLLAAGANPNMIANGHTALGYAVGSLKLDIITTLLKNGADPNLRSNNQLPLCRVLRTTGVAKLPERQQAIIDVMIAADADFTLPCKEDSNHTPLHISTGYGQREVIRAVAKKGSTLSLGRYDQTFGNVLHEAIKTSDTEWLKILLTIGISPDADTSSRMPVMAAAIKAGNSAMVKLLLEAGADGKVRSSVCWLPELIQTGLMPREYLCCIICSAAHQTRKDWQFYHCCLMLVPRWTREMRNTGHRS